MKHPWFLWMIVASGIVGCGSFRPTLTAVSHGQVSVASVQGQPFQFGVTHIDGRYRFSDKNFLEEGALRVLQLGSRELFVQMERNFRDRYPEFGGTPWGENIHSLKDLAQTKPFENVFALPFHTYLLTAFTFGVGDQPFRDQHTNYEELLQREEAEFFELTKYLLRAYNGSHKTFILKNWEGDWWGLRSYDGSRSLSASDAEDLVRFFSARQRGILRARAESNVQNVWVLQAIEVNRVDDLASNPSLGRVTNRVIPYVDPAADMVAYSMYDTLLTSGSDSTIQTRVMRAIHLLLNTVPDPLGLGPKRLILSEVGVPENQGFNVGETERRLNIVLRVGQTMNLHSASLWNLYDNECKYRNSSIPISDVGLSLSDPRRPRAADCSGFYAIRPDGSEPTPLRILKSHWNQIRTLLPPIPDDFRPIPETITPPVGPGTGVPFRWESVSFECSQDCSCVQIKIAGEQPNAEIGVYAREANATWDLIGRIESAMYQKPVLTIPLDETLRQKVTTTGLRFTVTEENTSIWDTTAELTCSPKTNSSSGNP